MKHGEQLHPFKEKGFFYIGILMLIAVFGLTSNLVATYLLHEQQREQEKELLRIGLEVQNGIMSYYENSPGAIKKYPKSWNDLVLDYRFLAPKRHIRRIPIDPITHQNTWGLIVNKSEEIMGFYSLAEGTPIKQRNFNDLWPMFAHFEDSKNYQRWVFLYAPK